MTSTLQFTEFAGVDQLVGSLSAPGTVLFAWSLNKNTLITTDAVVHLKYAGVLQRPNNGVHIYLIVGGGPTDLTGVATAETEYTVAGLFASAILPLNISTLYASGRLMEFIKVVAYKDTDGGLSPFIHEITVEMQFPPF